MWTIIKFDKKRLGFLKKDFREKLGEDFAIYSPKLTFKKYKNNSSFVHQWFIIYNAINKAATSIMTIVSIMRMEEILYLGTDK